MTLRNGRRITGARPSDYPLGGVCDRCGIYIKLADGTADWCHIDTGQSLCDVELGVRT